MANAQLGTVLRQLRGLVEAPADENTSDGDLLRRFVARGDEAAFVALLRRHGPMVLHVCRRVQGNEQDAEDAFQAAFLVLARRAGSIRKPDSVASFLHGVARRLALAARGRDARRQARERRAATMRRTPGTADALDVYTNDSLDWFRTVCKKKGPADPFEARVKGLDERAGALFAATTDADGRFTLAGAGVERLVSLHLRGAGIADTLVYVVTRPGFDPKPYNDIALARFKAERFGWVRLLHGPDSAVVAERGKTVRGVVKDADTGAGRAGIDVWLTRAGDDLLLLPLRTRTDAAGRFAFRGARKAKSYGVEVLDDPAGGYMPRQVRADDTPGYGPVVADIPVKKGVIVTGRVLDRATGKGVPGFVMADVLNGNRFAKAYGTFRAGAWIPIRETAADGTFRVVTTPGPVILMGGPSEPLPGGVKYQGPVIDPDYPQYFDRRAPGYVSYYGLGGGISPCQGNFCKVLEIKPGARIVEQDIILKREAGPAPNR
jgi:RNA polymerase sigma factor (sigma-70 family)